MKHAALHAFCWVGLLSAGRAAAHAPPVATDIFWATGSGAERAVVRTNRGLIFEGDEPKSFSIACNDAFFVGLAEVPPVVPRDDGRLLIGTYQAGLVLSSRDHCDYSMVGGPLEGINVIDVARGSGGMFYALVLPLDGSAPELFESSGGETFQSRAVFSSIPNAIALAAADVDRVYVSASVAQANENAAVLLVSTDGGHAFAERAIALDPSELRAFVRAVDPSDPDRVFVRTQSRDGIAPERLLLSEDAGETFQAVLVAGGPIVVHAASDAIWAGTAQGLYRSSDRGRSFAPIGPAFITHIGCVSRHDGALYVCGYSESQLAFGVLVSVDEGSSFRWFLEFPAVKERLACDLQSLEGAFCGGPFADWSVEQGIAGSGGSSVSNGGTSGSTAGTGGSTAGTGGSTAGTGGSTASTGGNGEPTAGACSGAACGAGIAGALAPTPRPGSGCALKAPASRSNAWAQALAMLGALAAYRRQRRFDFERRARPRRL